MKLIKQYFLWAEYKRLRKRIDILSYEIEHIREREEEINFLLRSTNDRVRLLIVDIKNALKESK